MKFEIAHYSYWVFIILLMAGLYVVIAKGNLIKKMIGLNVFQVAVIMFYVSMGKIDGGTAPIVDPRFTVYSNPVPHVLMLTAIVVGVATTAVGLALIVRIHEAYGSIEDDEIRAAQAAEDAGAVGTRA
jgi:multicomponent Na+:H+ antiporter subunit C